MSISSFSFQKCHNVPLSVVQLWWTCSTSLFWISNTFSTNIKYLQHLQILTLQYLNDKNCKSSRKNWLIDTMRTKNDETFQTFFTRLLLILVKFIFFSFYNWVFHISTLHFQTLLTTKTVSNSAQACLKIKL